ncbi:MAG: hypothetical protein RIR70_154 [Pseudomonadota bacterium]|jgi:cytochrome b561
MQARYHGVAIALHWLMAALIAGGFALGLIMTELDLSPQKLKLYAWHKWLGVTVFLLLWLRLLVRLIKRAPPPLPAPAWAQRTAAAVHGLLYGLMLLLPVSGWLMSSAAGFQTVWFGVVPLPDLLPKNEAVFETLKAVHEVLGNALALAVMLHVAAALKHHFIDRDHTLARMGLMRRKP